MKVKRGYFNNCQSVLINEIGLLKHGLKDIDN